MSPSTRVVYLGIQIDSELMEISLPVPKLEKIRNILSDFLTLERCSKRELKVLAGNLSHARVVVKGGGTFSRRIINVIKYLPDGARHYSIPDCMKDDLEWWDRFIHDFNGKAKVIKARGDFELVMGTESSLTGLAAVWQADWLTGYWRNVFPRLDVGVPSHYLDLPPMENSDCNDINVLESWPVLVAIKQWGPQWKDSKVRLWTDNTQVLQMINTGRSRSVWCMGWSRELFWACVVHNVHLVPSHISSVDDIVPDYLSWLFDQRRKGKLPVELLLGLCCYRDGWVEGEDLTLL